jgi:hypothetical protein
MLQKFCGKLASAFPNTDTVESDVSIIGWEKNDNKVDLTDTSLEDILFSKQFNDCDFAITLETSRLSRDLSTL